MLIFKTRVNPNRTQFEIYSRYAYGEGTTLEHWELDAL